MLPWPINSGEQEEAMNLRRLASATLSIVITIVIVNPQSAFASAKTDVTAAVHQFFDNLGEKSLQTALGSV
jgi:hypothetical protein